LKRYDANLRGCICCEGYVVMAPTEYGIGEYVTHKDAAATIQRIKDESLDNFTRSVATIREEYQEEIAALEAELAPLRALFPNGPLHEQVAAEMNRLQAACHDLHNRLVKSESQVAAVLGERDLLSLALTNCQIALVKSEQDATERWREGVQYIANKICGEIPEGYSITLEMENGSASVGLFDWQNEENIELPEQDEPYVHKWLTEALDAALQAGAKSGDET
jgi:hypothetical protein